MKMEHDISKNFAGKLAVMLDTSLIHYKYYELWCDKIIESMKHPPECILALTDTKYLPDARNIVSSYAFADPAPDFSYSDFYLTCLYMKYIKKHISWATFLLSAGEYSDGNDCYAECEFFYSLLTQLEAHEFSASVEQEQSNQVRKKLWNLIEEADRLYEYFLTYFRQYCKTK
jgi:hypothetical protein